MNDELKFQILKLCSGHYLATTIPNNWKSLTEEEQDEFLTNNCWEPLENYSPENVWDYIEAAAEITQEFIQSWQQSENN